MNESRGVKGKGGDGRGKKGRRGEGRGGSGGESHMAVYQNI